MKIFFSTIVLSMWCIAAMAQQKIQVRIVDQASKEALEAVTISCQNKWIGTTDSTGTTIIELPGAQHPLRFALMGYEQIDTIISMPYLTELTICMSSSAASLEEVTILSSTRSNQNMESSPMKVEVLGAEEMSEEAAIKPGNIASILGDVSGVQIQQSSATSGNSNVRIQGLGGKYTQILRDGMPLYDGFSGGFGILSVPPLDLKQIELIKGSASTLYGGGAIGGLVNLISKRPNAKQEADLILNYTSLKELNANVYLSKRNRKLGYTLFAGYTNQQAVDVNKDGLSDVARNNALLLHPKLFYYPSDNTIVSLGYSGSFDDRNGGDMLVLDSRADAVHQYFERNKTQRHTAEYFVEHFLNGKAKLTVKGNLSNFSKLNASNINSLKGNQLSYYNEASVYKPFEKSELVLGINVVGDNYETIAPDTALLQRFTNLTAGLFSQYSVHIQEKTTLELGMRLDLHQRYGLFALPRIAAFHRFNQHWAARVGFGVGYKVPNPLVPQNYEINVFDLLALNNTVRSEISYGYNAEFNYKKEWGEHTSIFVNQAFFLTNIERPILFNQTLSGRIDLVNASANISSKGFDTYVKMKLWDWELYLGCTFTDARNHYLPANTFIPLTPKIRGAFVVVKEFAEHWRIGIEGSYTGSQYRYDYTKTPSYVFLAAMIQRNIGRHISLVLNGENLLDYRMSKIESLYTGTITAPAFKPLWAPIDGRVVNVSLRWKW